MGLPLIGLATSLLGGGGGGGGAGLPGFTDTGSAVSGATLGPVNVGGLNLAPPAFKFDATTIALGVGIAVVAVVALKKRKR